MVGAKGDYNIGTIIYHKVTYFVAAECIRGHIPLEALEI